MTSLSNDPTRRPEDRKNSDVERVPQEKVERDPGMDGRVGPEDEDSKVRPGEKRPAGIMP